MDALVLEAQNRLSIRKFDSQQQVGPNDLRIKMHTVGLCGTDVHLYRHGGIGRFRVENPLVLGHEGAGTVVEVGSAVKHLQVGDRVAIEPSVPKQNSRALREGYYNADQSMISFAGLLALYVVHPAAYTYKLPDNLSFAEGALVEPLSVGVHAAMRAQVKPGDIAVVLGGGTIGVMCTVAALAAGCSRVVVCDVLEEKLALIAKHLPPHSVTTCCVAAGKEALQRTVEKMTNGWGANVVFEASGNPKTLEDVDRLLCPRSCLAIVGAPQQSTEVDLFSLQRKEIRIELVMGYCNAFPRAVELMNSGQFDLKAFITRTVPFSDSVHALAELALGKTQGMKTHIQMPS